ncbi:MAG: tetratricopeptide repeat protein [Bacteroidales bacterium]|nr:tetratricopeptide repeat protein [Bacteroidales bacterium]
MKTCYYQGRIQQDNGNLSAAAIAFSQAEYYAEEATDTHAVALLYNAFASIYDAVHNTQKELEYVEKELSVMKESGDPMYYSALGNLAMVYHTRKDWALADSLYQEAISHSDAYPHALAIYLSNYARMKLLHSEKDPQGAIDLLNRKREISSGVLSPKEVGAYAYALDLLGNRKTADALIDRLQALPDASRSEVVSWLYRISLSRGDQTRALTYLRAMLDVEYEEVVETLSDSVSQALQDYYFQKAQQERERKLQQGVLGLSTIVLLLLLAIALLLRERRLRLERDRLISIRAALEQDLREQENRTEIYSSELSSRIELLRKQMQQERLDRLRNSGRYGYWLWMEQNSRFSDKEVVRALRKDLQEICAIEQDYRALERRLDRELDGLFSRLKEDLGLNGKTQEERFLCFWLTGLRADMIAELMGITTNNVYVKTHRLEERIRQLDDPDYLPLVKGKTVKTPEN